MSLHRANASCQHFICNFTTLWLVVVVVVVVVAVFPRDNILKPPSSCSFELCILCLVVTMTRALALVVFVAFGYCSRSAVRVVVAAAAHNEQPADCSALDDLRSINPHEKSILGADGPSPAPSPALACDQETSNARGHYTSTMTPCLFYFHAAAKDAIEMDFIEFHTSDLCTEGNAIGGTSMAIKEYVDLWPDECVGDFARCYSMLEHQNVFLEFMCAKEWQVPEGTTHISVDCSLDRELEFAATKRERYGLIQEKNEKRRNTYELKLANLVIVFFSCVVGILLISQLIVKPFRFTLLARDVNNDCSNNDASCLVLEEQHDNPNESSPTEQEQFDMQIPADFDAIQIPADFDAIPIVPAFLLPPSETDDHIVVHAEASR
jgi:hypothetical protein